MEEYTRVFYKNMTAPHNLSYHISYFIYFPIDNIFTGNNCYFEYNTYFEKLKKIKKNLMSYNIKIINEIIK